MPRSFTSAGKGLDLSNSDDEAFWTGVVNCRWQTLTASPWWASDLLSPKKEDIWLSILMPEDLRKFLIWLGLVTSGLSVILRSKTSETWRVLKIKEGCVWERKGCEAISLGTEAGQDHWHLAVVIVRRNAIQEEWWHFLWSLSDQGLRSQCLMQFSHSPSSLPIPCLFSSWGYYHHHHKLSVPCSFVD